ncbi:30S ribosomal protein S9 [candidate division TM6 bacterium JCVI TM6SC1]|uniref:30S ribosomal protein S9 n=1 Tax=candidate division TM6 bacterium JCVI TM6SC1 TaxID=1306947 RepID=A0A0D2K676_9BACT|nr:30S ribosomal protein S9 [candidate division TM6 bacterium JCVI TM6SC1]
MSHGVGRRKSSVARVWLRRGTGNITINKRPVSEYFTTQASLLEAVMPMNAINAAQVYDIDVNVVGGGFTGQAGAVKLGIARALVQADEGLRIALREFDLLSVDSRVKERKKYGQKAARRRFQFVKR